VAAGNANNANDVVIGNTVQDTWKTAIGSGSTPRPGEHHWNGTVANPLATITWVNGGSAEIQATTPGTGVAGNHTGNFVAVALNLATPAHGTVATSNTGFLGGGAAGVDLSSSVDAATALTAIGSAISTVAATGVPSGQASIR